MIVCPNCNHQNPDGATQCEACFTPLPAMSNCPNCGASVQTDATFCGQCGCDLRAPGASSEQSAVEGLPPTVVAAPPIASTPISVAAPLVTPDLGPVSIDPQAGEPQPMSVPAPAPVAAPAVAVAAPAPAVAAPAPVPAPVAAPAPGTAPAVAAPVSSSTQLQQVTAKLLHVQTNTTMELPPHLSVIHIGKPNDRVPPDIDVSGFPNSEIVSRVHADIRVEGDGYYIEDLGSANGSYINNFPLPAGNRHRLRAGDRIALGKGDLVTFLFQIS